MAITEFGADNLFFSSGLRRRARNHAVVLRGRRRGVEPSLFVVFLRVREGFGSHAFSGLRMQFSGVCCCSFTLLSSTPMSAPSTPLLSRLVQMSCTHPHANLRLRSCLFLHMFTCATPASLSQCNIGARRSRCEDCIWLSPAQRVPLRLPSRVEQLSRLLRRTGRVGRCGAHAHARVRACLVLARSRLTQQFSGCL